MVERHEIDIPAGLAAEWSDDQVTRMAEVALALDHMWDHAIGPDWRDEVSLHRVKELFHRM